MGKKKGRYIKKCIVPYSLMFYVLDSVELESNNKSESTYNVDTSFSTRWIIRH